MLPESVWWTGRIIQPSGVWTCRQAPVTLTPTRDVRLSARRPNYGAYGLPSYVFELILRTSALSASNDSRCVVIQDGRGSGRQMDARKATR